MKISEIGAKLSNIEIELNRLRSAKAALENREKIKNNQQRKARTRTLIQIGGLAELTPLLSICDINLGDDLQTEHREKAALLLGILTEFANAFPEKLSDDDIEKFRKSGLKLLAEK